MEVTHVVNANGHRRLRPFECSELCELEFSEFSELSLSPKLGLPPLRLKPNVVALLRALHGYEHLGAANKLEPRSDTFHM